MAIRYAHGIIVSWVSRNSGSVCTRSVSVVFYNMIVQLGNIIALNSYREDDVPLYYRGNDIPIALCTLAILLIRMTKGYYI